MGIDSQNGQVAWHATADDVGAHLVSLAVKDEQGGADSQTFLVRVKPLNTPLMMKAHLFL